MVWRAVVRRSVELSARAQGWRRGAASLPRRAGATLRVRAVTGVVALTAVVFTTTVLRTRAGMPGEVFIPWWGIAVAYFLSGVLIAHVRIRNQAYTLTLSEVPLVLGLAASTPVDLLAGGLAGTVLALVVFRRQPLLKLAFNSATFLVEADIGIVVMQTLLGHSPAGSGTGWLATLAGTLAASAFAQTIVMVVVMASAGSLPIQQVTRTLALMLPAAVLNTLLGLAGLHAAGRDPLLLLPLLIPVVVVATAYRSYLAERQRHGQVRQLYEASGALHRARGADAAIATLLARGRDMFNADVAELAILPADRCETARCFTLGPGEGPVVVSDEAAAAFSGLSLAGGGGGGSLLANTGPTSLLAVRGLRDGIAVPIATDGGVSAVLMVANLRDAVSTFGRVDVELLEALAGPASVSLENGRLHAELEHQAFHDPLTGLANRALLARRIRTALAEGPRGRFTVLLLDVDDFKAINDTLGHPAGDQLLIQISQRVRDCLRAADTAARLGGDEFAVVLRTTASADDAVAVADRILDSLRRPFTMAAVDVTVRASLGIVVDDASVASVDDLLSRADIAMYRAKALGKDRSVVFEPVMHIEVMARHQLLVDLEQAVSAAQLCVHYQPIVSLLTGEITGAEALVRWVHPTRGMVQPDSFIPVAEESGLIIPLGRFVLEEACRQLMDWKQQLPDLRLCVNVSARELQDPELVTRVIDICARRGVQIDRLTFEVTEHVMVDDDRALAALRELRALGARIAIDDFGAGYSSLSCLGDLPVDTLKIAKPFVDRLARSEDDRALATSVVGLARSLRMDTVVEGIERVDQADLMRQAGCRHAQGFLFSRALPAAEFAACAGSRTPEVTFLAVSGRSAPLRWAKSAG